MNYFAYAVLKGQTEVARAMIKKLLVKGITGKTLARVANASFTKTFKNG